MQILAKLGLMVAKNPRIVKQLFIVVLLIGLVFATFPIVVGTLLFSTILVDDQGADKKLIQSYIDTAKEYNLDWSELVIFNYVLSNGDFQSMKADDARKQFIYYTEELIYLGDGYYKIERVRRKRDLEQVMSRNYFTQEQKEWADFLKQNFREQFAYYFDDDYADEINPPNAGFFMWPAPDLTRVTSRYGKRYLFGVENFHYGVDLAAPKGSSEGKPIYAAAAGEVYQVEESDSCGLYIRIQHDEGWQSRYCHLSKQLVREGDRVKKGKKIGLAGSTGQVTGAHLHFELKKNGQILDPLPFISGE